LSIMKINLLKTISMQNMQKKNVQNVCKIWDSKSHVRNEHSPLR
jgi:hypothetical protein